MDTEKYIQVSVGVKFGRLTVSSFAGRVNRRIIWNCICDCGNFIAVRQCGLMYGGTKSCGCLKKEHDYSKNHLIHGMSKTRTYKSWAHMKDRCDNKNNHKFYSYGGRGISVCERWHSFENFLSDMGEVPEGMSIDRVDNDGNYEPSNCRWATCKEQNNNTRRTKFISYNGLSITISELADIVNIPRDVLNVRLKRGWSLERSILQPIRIR